MNFILKIGRQDLCSKIVIQNALRLGIQLESVILEREPHCEDLHQRIKPKKQIIQISQWNLEVDLGIETEQLLHAKDILIRTNAQSKKSIVVSTLNSETNDFHPVFTEDPYLSILQKKPICCHLAKIFLNNYRSISSQTFSNYPADQDFEKFVIPSIQAKLILDWLRAQNFTEQVFYPQLNPAHPFLKGLALNLLRRKTPAEARPRPRFDSTLDLQ